MVRHQAIAAALALAGVLGAGCATGSGSGSGRVLLPQASLELRQAQTRAFEGVDARAALKAVVDVLQDEGFFVREADADLGLVSAVKQWQSSRNSKGLTVLKWVAAPMTYGASLLVPSGRNEYSSLEANVSVTSEAARTRIRVSLAARVTDKKGEILRVETVQDPLAYQAILGRLDRALYLHGEGL